MIETPEEVIGSLREDAVVAWVYYLASPGTPRRPRYVGTTTDLVTRQRTHAKTHGSHNARLIAWKDELRAANLAPLLVPVASFVTVEQARAAEWRLIQRWRRRGLCDCNNPRDGSGQQWAAMCAGMNGRRGVA